MRTYHPLQTLPAGTELANCSETLMAYEPVLCAALFFLYQSLSKYNQSELFLSIEVLPFLGAVAWDGRQGSFAAFGFCGLTVWAANVP
jgi:uncharacterized membrane protein